MHSLYDGNLTYQKVVRRLEFHRLVERGIVSIMNFQFGAVLGSQGCREKKIQTAISMQFLRSDFYVFMVKKTFLNIVESTIKSYIA